MPQATITRVFEPDGRKPGAVVFDDGVKASFWYGTAAKPGPKPGAFVVGQSGQYIVTEKQNGEYVNTYLKTWTPNGSPSSNGGSAPLPAGNRDRSIVVQCCIKSACDRFSGMEAEPDEILRFATSLGKFYDQMMEGPKKPAPVGPAPSHSSVPAVEEFNPFAEDEF